MWHVLRLQHNLHWNLLGGKLCKYHQAGSTRSTELVLLETYANSQYSTALLIAIGSCHPGPVC